MNRHLWNCILEMCAFVREILLTKLNTRLMLPQTVSEADSIRSCPATAACASTLCRYSSSLSSTFEWSIDRPIRDQTGLEDELALSRVMKIQTPRRQL